MKRRMWLAPIVIASGVTLSACASINPNTLPQPGKAYSDGYDIVIEFDDVLNLPERAKVVMAGMEVGVVTNVAVVTRQVDVTARIDANVEVPSNVHAALQQATVLGDISVALDLPPDQPAAPALPAGARIPLVQTTSPPQLEDTMANLASFTSSGSIQSLQNSIVGINRVTPPDGELRKLASQAAADLADLSNNIDVLHEWFNGVSATGEVLHNRLPSYQFWFSPKGMLGFDRTLQLTTYLSSLFPSVGSVYSGGFWLVPLLKSLADATGALQQSKFAIEDEWPAWRRLFSDFYLPQDKYPAINITSIIGPDGQELSGKVADVLRILGAAP